MWRRDTELIKLVEIIPGRDASKEQKADLEGPYFDRIYVAMGHPERIILFLSWF
jgi:hypothetical protein